MTAKIEHIEYYLPPGKLTNEQLAKDFPGWSVDKIYKKTGIIERRIVSNNETALDLAFEACSKILSIDSSIRDEIDYIIFCTQSPDYKLPTTACILQSRLELSKSIGAIDINQGCSGFVYALGLSKALIETKQSKCVLLVTAETYTKYINPNDKSVRTLFGDGAAATIVKESEIDGLTAFEYATDGSGANNLIVKDGGAKNPINEQSSVEILDSSANKRSNQNLYMNGAEVFTFTLTAVKDMVQRVLNNSELKIEEIDHFVFHQPNKFMLDQIMVTCGIPKEKLHRNYKFIGNTVSSTIPILLKDLDSECKLQLGQKILICGFGVGYSAAGSIIEW